MGSAKLKRRKTIQSAEFSFWYFYTKENKSELFSDNQYSGKDKPFFSVMQSPQALKHGD